MKRLLFSIVSVLQFVAMASCKKCVTCNLWYYYNMPAAVITQSGKFCGTTKQIKAYEAGYSSGLDTALSPTADVQVVCDESK